MNTRFFTQLRNAWKSSRNISSLQTRMLGNIRSVGTLIPTKTISDCKLLPHEDVIKHQQRWLDKLNEETKKHCTYLASIGLADRVNYFKVNPFVSKDSEANENISRFNQSMDVPKLVDVFNPHEKNTLFSNDKSSAEDQLQEIKHSLDIRLYPTMRQLIEKKGVNVFLGSKNELQTYTESLKEKIIIEVEVPSSVKFYIALNTLGDIKIYLANLVSHENLIQQLITLKLAGIDIQKVPILGDTQHYKKVCKEDLIEFESQAANNLLKRNVLIVAGCSQEDMVCSTLEHIFFGKISKKKFTGNLVSLTYVKSENVPNLGFIVLNLNYGEICEEQISIILEKFNCIGIFSGSAAGYISKEITNQLPEIGNRVAVHSAKHHSGEVVTLDHKNENLHLHVPTIFMETFDWLKNARALGGTTVDVETFYILRAIKNHQEANPHKKLSIDIGVFISDYLGKKPLRSYENVFAKYPLILKKFISKVLVANIVSSYNSNRLSNPTFKQESYSIVPQQVLIEQSTRREAVVDSIGRFWDKSEFSKRVHTPVTIGEVKEQDIFSKQKVPRCLHLPIKLPGSNIRIPKEYQHFSDALQRIFDFEISINSKNWDELYAYLTVDQGFVPKSNSQRVPGPHVDGIPRNRDNPEKQLIDHAYLVTDEIPTMYYMQKFDMMPYDPKIHHFFAIFRALSDESRAITIKPFDIVLMDAYSVHTPMQIQKDVHRTFVRLEFSTLKFDRLGNSINPHFLSDDKFHDYPFNYIPRPIPSNLFLPPDIYLNKPITNKDYSHELIDNFGRANLHAIFTENERVKLKDTDYKNLSLISNNIMNSDTQGMVMSYHGVPHAFCLYRIENKKVKLDTIFTLQDGKGQEIMIYGMKILKKLADKLAIQAGLKEDSTPISIVINDNNEEMLGYFLRAARLAKVEIIIEKEIVKHLSATNQKDIIISKSEIEIESDGADRSKIRRP